VLFDEKPNDDVLMTTVRATDPNTIAVADETVGLGCLIVDVDLATLTGTFRLRTCLEQARHIEPDVQANRVFHAFRCRCRLCFWP